MKKVADSNHDRIVRDGIGEKVQSGGEMGFERASREGSLWASDFGLTRTSLILLIAAMLGGLLWWGGQRYETSSDATAKEFDLRPPISGEMSQEAYLWQRVWTASVEDAVRQRSGSFARLTVLCVEMHVSGAGEWEVERMHDSIQGMETKSPLAEAALAIRIGANAAELGWTPEAVANVVHVLRPLSALSGVLQVDYDCPSSKLGDYLALLQGVRLAFPDHQLEITCLPDWLGWDAFPVLLGQVDRYVMQVHGVTGYGGAGTLCDPELARATVRKCGHYEVPFMVALPTYRHAVRRGDRGQVIEVVSEGGELSPGVDYELMGAKHGEMASLIRGWNQLRPASMQGVIWYRLPVEGERMNWTWSSMQQVMKGQDVRAEPVWEMQRRQDGSYALILKNPTQAHLEWPKSIAVNWFGGFCVAADASGDYRLEGLERRGGLQLKWLPRDPRPVQPGQEVELAWFRFESSAELSFSIDGSSVRGESR